MTDPDAETIRMIGDCMRFQNPEIAPPAVPVAYDHYPQAYDAIIEPTDHGIEGVGTFELESSPATEAPWPV